MLPPEADRRKLVETLDRLSEAVEDLLQSGLTTASDSTRQTLSAALQEAARFRLLRLGSTLRGAAEELGRFTAQAPDFSRRRLTFFLNRAWLLARGLARALGAGDEAGYDRLNWSPPTRPLPEVEVACLGAVKKVAAGAFVAFDFRLRAVNDAEPVAAGQRLSWSVIFPSRPGVEIPPEGFLHLPQKQKFKPTLFLDRITITIRDAALSVDGSGAGRITLTDSSTLAAGKAFEDWPRFLDWSPRPARDRLARHRPGLLDLETELQEEVILSDYTIGPPAESGEPGQSFYPVEAGLITFQAVVGRDPEGKALRRALDALRKPKAKRPPLFGLLHYEQCRLVLQPLATFGDDGPDYLTISKDNVDRAALLKALSLPG